MPSVVKSKQVPPVRSCASRSNCPSASDSSSLPSNSVQSQRPCCTQAWEINQCFTFQLLDELLRTQNVQFLLPPLAPTSLTAPSDTSEYNHDRWSVEPSRLVGWLVLIPKSQKCASPVAYVATCFWMNLTSTMESGDVACWSCWLHFQPLAMCTWASDGSLDSIFGSYEASKAKYASKLCLFGHCDIHSLGRRKSRGVFWVLYSRSEWVRGTSMSKVGWQWEGRAWARKKRGGKHGVCEQRNSWGEFWFDYRIAIDMDQVSGYSIIEPKQRPSNWMNRERKREGNNILRTRARKRRQRKSVFQRSGR